jgi:Gas vesicle synthesis protein GvpL/GvpF
MARETGTYVYGVVAAARRPSLTRVPAGLPGTGRLRLLDVEPRLYVVAADAPLARYGEAAIRKGLADLDWVSRAAVAHERVVEFFVDATAVLPMKLFTIFTSDARAVDFVRGERGRLSALVTRVANHQEWGVRVVLDPARASKAAAPKTQSASATGAAYLSRKRAQRDAVAERTQRAREIVTKLYDRLAAPARVATRRQASELPVEGGPLLLDAAFLVPRGRARSFRALAAREARALAKQGYGLTLTGPWPPYTFVQD